MDPDYECDSLCHYFEHWPSIFATAFPWRILKHVRSRIRKIKEIKGGPGKLQF